MVLLFTYEGYKNSSQQWMYRLGVWNKEYGFKVIDIPEIENVHPDTFSTGEYLFVQGHDVAGRESIVDGYWGEGKQASSLPEVNPQPEENQPEIKPKDEPKKSWWGWPI